MLLLLLMKCLARSWPQGLQSLRPGAMMFRASSTWPMARCRWEPPDWKYCVAFTHHGQCAMLLGLLLGCLSSIQAIKEQAFVDLSLLMAEDHSSAQICCELSACLLIPM